MCLRAMVASNELKDFKSADEYYKRIEHLSSDAEV